MLIDTISPKHIALFPEYRKRIPPGQPQIIFWISNSICVNIDNTMTITIISPLNRPRLSFTYFHHRSHLTSHFTFERNKSKFILDEIKNVPTRAVLRKQSYMVFCLNEILTTMRIFSMVLVLLLPTKVKFQTT